jgi:hypothetical protein
MSTKGQAVQKFVQARRIKFDIHRGWEAEFHKQAWGRRPQFRFPFCNFPLQFLYE